METVRYEAEGPVVVVTIDRPEVRNAVDPPTAEALVEAFERLHQRLGRGRVDGVPHLRPVDRHHDHRAFGLISNRLHGRSLLPDRHRRNTGSEPSAPATLTCMSGDFIFDRATRVSETTDGRW